MQRLFVWLFVGTLSLSVVAAAIAAEEIIGHVEGLAGKVEVKGSKKVNWSNARPDMQVFFGDNVRTGDDGSALIRLVDDSIIRVQAGSHIVLNTIVSPVERKNSVLLFFGKIWNKISKKALRRKVFEVQTPTAVCGVRGTDFETASYDDGTLLVKVNTGEVEVDNETTRQTLSAHQGTRVNWDQNEIVAQSDYQPDWERTREASTENLLSDGKKYGGYVHDEIYKRRDEMQRLVDRAAELSERKRQLQAAAKESEGQDPVAFESYMAEIRSIGAEQRELNKKIAYNARRLACHFGLFAHYGDIAKHPVLSKRFRGRDFILNQLDNIELVRAEFDSMVEVGMKMSMEDMEDMMDEMRDKMRIYKDKKAGKDIFDEME